MAATLKKGVTVGPNGKINIAMNTPDISTDTLNKVITRNNAIATKEQTQPTDTTPTEQQTPTVVKTDVLQARIDARNKASQITQPTDQSVIDTSTGLPQGVQAPKTEPTTTETTTTKETIPPTTETPTAEPAKTTETQPVKTPEEQAKFDEQQKQQEADRLKVETEKAAEAAKQAEAAKNGEIKAPLTQDEAFGILSAGGKLDKSPQSAVYENQYAAYTKANSLPSSTLADLNAKGNLNPNALDYLQRTNPEKYAEVQKLTDDVIKINNINDSSKRLYNKANNKTIIPEKKKSETIMEDYVKKYNEGDAYTKTLMNSLSDGKMSDMVVDIADKDAKIQEMQDEIDKTYDDYRGQYPTLPKSMVMGMTAAATKDMNRELNTMIRERNVAFATYTAKKDDIETKIKYAQENMKNSMDFLSTLFQTTRAEEIRIEDFARADKLLSDQIAREDKKDEQRIKELNQARMDVMTQILLKYGGDPTKFTTYESMAGEAGRLAAQQTAYEQSLNKFNAETNRMNAQKSPTANMLDMGTDPLTGFKVYKNLSTGETISFNPQQNASYAIPDSFTSRALGNNNVPITKTDTGISIGIETGTPLGQCGTLPNDLFKGVPGYSPVTDTFKSKTDLVNTDHPVAGGAFIEQTPNKEFEKNGHIGIVESVNADGSINVMDTNWKQKDGKGVVDRRTIRPGDEEYKRIVSTGGFYDPSIGAGQSKLFNALSPSDQETVRQMINYETLPPTRTPGKGQASYNQLVAAAGEKLPGYSVTQFDAAKKFKQQMASGGPTTVGGIVTSSNTALAHISGMWDTIEGLGNDKVAAKNAFINWSRDALSDPNISSYETARTAVATEVAKALKGGVADKDENAKWYKNFDIDKGPEYIKASLKTAADELGKRIQKQTEAYKRNVTIYPPSSLVDPDNQYFLKNIGLDPDKYYKLPEKSSSNTNFPSDSTYNPTTGMGTYVSPSGNKFIITKG